MIKKHKELIIILFTFVFLVFFLIVKINSYNNFIPEWDESLHLIMGFRYYKNIIQLNILEILNLFKYSDQIYPPFYHWTIALCYLLFGVSSNTGVFANIPFIFIMMMSIYGLGITLGNKLAGVIAATTTPFLPVFLTLQERSTIDYASVSIFILSFYLLFRTNYFTNRKYSIILGLVLLLQLLIKWPFIIPSLPFIFYALASIYINKGGRKNVIINIFVAIFISLPALIWYFFNFQSFYDILGFFWNPNGFPQIIWSNPKGLTFNNFALYLLTYPIQGSGVGITVLIYFFAALFYAKRSTKLIYLYSSILITFIVLTYLNDKSAYYITYAYPLLMLVTINFLLTIKKRIKKIVLILIFCSTILLNFAISIKNNPDYNEVYLNFFIVDYKILPKYSTRFLEKAWPTERIVKNYITKEKCKNGVLVLTDNRFLNPPNIKYYIAIHSKNVETRAGYEFYNPSEKINIDVSFVNKFDCIVSKTGFPGVFANEYTSNLINNYLDHNKDYIRMSFEIPGNDYIYLFTKRES